MEVSLAKRRIAVSTEGISRPIPRGYCADIFPSNSEIIVTSALAAFTVPEEFNGWSYKSIVASVDTQGSTFTLQFVKKRAGVSTTVLTKVIDANAWYMTEDIATSDDSTLQTGDRLFIIVSAANASPPLGLSVTVMFKNA